MGTINEINGNFIGNATLGHGGAIKNAKEIKNIAGDFIANSAEKRGGAIYNDLNKTIGSISGDLLGTRLSNTVAPFLAITELYLAKSAAISLTIMPNRAARYIRLAT